MTITKTLNNGILTLAPEGRIDIVTAPELEEVFNSSTEKFYELIVDFEKVDYISSAGLRVLLRAHKKMVKDGGYMKVIHVRDDVMEVFVNMGFKDILNFD